MKKIMMTFGTMAMVGAAGYGAYLWYNNNKSMKSKVKKVMNNVTPKNN